MLQRAGKTVCSKRKHFNRPRSISLFSFLFKRLPSPDMNAVTDSFYGKELGLPFLPYFLRSDRLAPYCPFPLLAGILLPLSLLLSSRMAALLGYAQSWYCTASLAVANASDRFNDRLFRCCFSGPLGWLAPLWFSFYVVDYFFCASAFWWSLRRGFSCCFLLVFPFDFFPLSALAS